MLVIVGVAILLLAAVVAIVSVLSNAGAAHPPTDFSVSGYDLSGSTATVFLFGIQVGAVALLGLSVSWPARWSAHTMPDAHLLAFNTRWLSSTATLLFVGMIVGVVCKTRAQERRVNADASRDRTEDDARRLRRRQALTDAYDARTQAAQVEIDHLQESRAGA
jgi:hypothetical protein